MSDLSPIAHCLLFSDLPKAAPGHPIEIGGEEAHHAVRVKRVREGERVAVLDGAGRVATGAVAQITGSKSRPALVVELELVEIAPPIVPAVEVWGALPKGDHLDRMIDMLAQLGVTGYRPLLCQRSQRKPETVRPEKLARIADEAMKQCRRPWAMRIGAPIGLPEALSDPDAMIADASGIAYPSAPTRQRAVILVGPEGGWSQQERDLIVDSGVPVHRFGRFVLRIEAAACAASAIVLGSVPAPEVPQP